MTAVACVLCGDRNPFVRVALIAWRDPTVSDPFGHGPRCPDHEACRARVLAAGEEWPVWERGKRWLSASIPGAAYPGDVRYIDAHPGLASGD